MAPMQPFQHLHVPCRALRVFGGKVPPSEYDDNTDDRLSLSALTSRSKQQTPSASSTSSNAENAKLQSKVRVLEEQLEEAQAQLEALKAGPLPGAWRSGSSLSQRISNSEGSSAVNEGADDLCSPDGHGCGDKSGSSKARKLGEGSSSGTESGSVFGPGGWLGPWQSKMSISLNLALLVIVLMLVTAPRRRRPKTLRSVQ